MDTASQIQAGQRVETRRWQDINGSTVAVPSEAARLTHLQFRRFAGCPICNLHIRELANRAGEIERAGIREVIVFASDEARMQEMLSDLPFTFVADPQKALYREFGLRSSLGAVLSVRAIWAGISGLARNLSRVFKMLPFGEDPLVNPAEFLIDADGRVRAAKYGTHAYDQWSIDELLELARAHSGAAKAVPKRDLRSGLLG